MTENLLERPRRLRAVLFALLAATAAGLAAADHAVAGTNEHVVTFINRCRQQVWIAEFGSTDIVPDNWALAPRCNANTASICPSGTCQNGACTCTSDADCTFGAPAGTPTASCDTNLGRCVSKFSISVPAGWSGRFWPRTGCSGSSTSFVCETGQCGPQTGGNIDCTVQGATANLATLFEITSGGASGTDNFDVSLVSGYNVPMAVKVVRPQDAPRWQPNTSYAAGAQIVAKVRKNVFSFTNGGQAGTSGATAPEFPHTWTASVADGPDITWVNTGPACEPSGCRRRGVKEKNCPADLKVTSTSSGEYIACDVPANACGQSGSSCEAGLSYYQCQNNDGEEDLFGNPIGLQSPNAETFVCFSAQDCPAGTTCQIDPTFVSSFTLPSGAGLCTPVAQNGGCTTDGDPCGHFPFVEYQCQTLADETSNAQVCVPPTTTGMGNLWWNAENWTAEATPPQCSTDADCGGSNKCLQGPATLGGLQQCPDGATCTCWSPTACTSNAACSQPNTCLNSAGIPDGQSGVDCSTDTCYCGPQAIYSGVCGATNQGWLDAAAALTDGSAKWPQGFKLSCPIAYSYQFDDPSSNWSCPNGASGLNDYRVILCGAARR